MNTRLFYILILVTCLGCKSQNTNSVKLNNQQDELNYEFYFGSNVEIKFVDEKTIANLFKLGKEWGKIKYHSSVVSNGSLNWDNELFRLLQSINNPDFDTILMKWSKSFPTNKKIEKNKYIDFEPQIGNPIFKNELPYPMMDWSDDGLKLLTLFRYWNIIEFFFPYKYQTDMHWDEVLKKYIPKFLESDNELKFKLITLHLIQETNDTHADNPNLGDIIETFFGDNILPIQTKFVENKFVVVNDFSESDSEIRLLKGDIITKINHVDIAQLFQEKKRYTISSNENVLRRNIRSKILRTNKESLQLSIIREANQPPLIINIKTIPVSSYNSHFIELIPSHKNLDNNIGYIYPASLKVDEIDLIMRKFKNKAGIIIDLRCYPSEFIVFSLSKYLLPSPKEFVKFSSTSVQKPGVFKFTKPLKVGEITHDYYKGKVAILVDETTQSNAEYTAMALRTSPNAVIIGSQTAGTDGNVSKITLPSNITTYISGLGVFYPDGRETQRLGLQIDINVKPSLDGIKKNKDEVLLKAKEFINHEHF